MMRPITFTADIQFTWQGNYCICYRATSHVQVVISFRLKEVIEQQKWSQLLPEDLDEIRSLCELGFVVEEFP